ncbi:hypothetical protein LP123_11655 [Moraxella bovis]|uniref:Uncharacterized protein n=1 Tax=Moraxella bovis TaxID=476 RepID=A0AAQ2SZ98_MORBO|nr:hypothetical protein [Moraxella bovis]OOR91801.1 hypothetical protein B0182_02355 [Moraxella bovis]UYZ76250.1 hypothetical protein LP093_02705 [Moraxella bovis]UYZ77798.1 hypothetical protein LP115_11100 [Moraxella bovis]UYZ80693.1 hypothetical protein LP113_11785 [Moraxella bovis]UYZ86284.1 hypothetical protein LP094_11150 [Moraxella bovis]
MPKKSIALYLLLAVVIAIVLTFLTFATPLGVVLYYTSLAFIVDKMTQGTGDTGIGIVIYWTLFANFIWGLVPLLLAYKKSKGKF